MKQKDKRPSKELHLNYVWPLTVQVSFNYTLKMTGALAMLAVALFITWAALFINRLPIIRKISHPQNCLNNAVRYKYYVEFSTSSAVFPQAACFINGGGTLASTMPNDPVFFPAVWCNGMDERLPVWCMVSGHTAGHRDKVILKKGEIPVIKITIS